MALAVSTKKATEAFSAMSSGAGGGGSGGGGGGMSAAEAKALKEENKALRAKVDAIDLKLDKVTELLMAMSSDKPRADNRN